MARPTLDVVIEDDAVRVGGRVAVTFQRTLRIPDDGRVYPLPPGLGRFPVIRARDFSDRVPEDWKDDTVAFIPMHQREAPWFALLFDVEVLLPATPANQRVLIQTDKFKTLGKFDAQPPVYKTRLPLGLYQIFLLGQEEPVSFEIAGTVALTADGHVRAQGVTHVDLRAPEPPLA
jgi:hypothetical protein